MMGSVLRQVAMACLVATMIPQVAATAVALHVLVDHGPEHGRSVPAGSMMPVLHGHAHSADTPEHDRPLTAPALGSVASHARGPLQQLALPVHCGGARVSHGPAGALAAGDRPANQRPTQVIPTVLRI